MMLWRPLNLAFFIRTYQTAWPGMVPGLLVYIFSNGPLFRLRLTSLLYLRLRPDGGRPFSFDCVPFSPLRRRTAWWGRRERESRSGGGSRRRSRRAANGREAETELLLSNDHVHFSHVHFSRTFMSSCAIALIERLEFARLAVRKHPTWSTKWRPLFRKPATKASKATIKTKSSSSSRSFRSGSR